MSTLENKTKGFFLPLLCVLMITYLAYGIGSVRTGFRGKDELRYAQIAKEMQEPSDYFFLHYQGEVYPDKPPLYFWMARACYAFTGDVSPWGIRAPLILCTLLSVLLTFDIGRRLFSVCAGLLGALFFGLSFRPIWSAHIARLDPPLALFNALAIWFVVRSLDRYEEGRRPTLGNTLGFWVAMALGFLVKGPLGLILPGGVLLTYLVVRGKWRCSIGLTTLPGVAIFLALLLGLWILPGWHYGGWDDYFSVIWDQEVIGRTTNPWRHVKVGFWYNALYYFGRILPEFLPGSLLLPGALALVCGRPARGKDDTDKKGLALVLSWFFFIFIFFTLMKSKRGQYILPLYPAGGLLIGWFLDRILDGEKMARGWTRTPLIILCIITALTTLALQFPLRPIEKEFGIALFLSTRLVILVLLGSVALVLFLAIRRNNLKLGIGGALALIPTIMITAFCLPFPRVNYEKTYQKMANFTQPYAGQKGIVYTQRSVKPEWNIWGDYFLRRFSDPPTLSALAIIPDNDFDFNPDGTRKIADLGEKKKKELKTRFNNLIFSTFFEHPEPLLMFLEKEEFDDNLAIYPQLESNLIKIFPIPNEEEKENVYLISNKKDHLKARTQWEMEREALSEKTYGNETSQSQ